MIGNLKTLSPAMAERWGFDLEAQLAHARALADKGRLLDGLWPEVFQREPFEACLLYTSDAADE